MSRTRQINIIFLAPCERRSRSTLKSFFV